MTATQPVKRRARSAIALLPQEALIKTNALDRGEWNSRGLLGAIQRKRFALVGALLGTGHGRLLEIGYGSGIFLPELATRCGELYGVDVHNRAAEVGQVILKRSIVASLSSAPAEHLPYEDSMFDAIVAVSALEFVDDIDQVCREMARVLRYDGIGVFVTPGQSRVLDLGLRSLTGERAEDTFKGRRQLVLPALHHHFAVEATRRFPRVPWLWLYTAVRVRGRRLSRPDNRSVPPERLAAGQ